MEPINTQKNASSAEFKQKLIDISSFPVVQVLDVLLQDKTTKKNIIWATDTYEELGEEFSDKMQLDANTLLH